MYDVVLKEKRYEESLMKPLKDLAGDFSKHNILDSGLGVGERLILWPFTNAVRVRVPGTAHEITRGRQAKRKLVSFCTSCSPAFPNSKTTETPEFLPSREIFDYVICYNML